MKEARRNRMMVVLAGMATAVATLSMPVGFIETVLASSGLSEAMPAAAPPIGLKGQGLIAAFTAVMAMGLAGMMGRDPVVADDVDEEDGRATRAQGARKMGFAFSKLTALARGRSMPVDEPEAPVLRRADAHPDAPARAPIFASRDFDGIEIFARPDSGRADTSRRPVIVQPAAPAAEAPAASPRFASTESVQPSIDRVSPTPAFLRPILPVTDTVEPEIDIDLDDAEPIEPIMEAEDLGPIAPIEPAPAPLPLPLPTAGLSVTQLTDRLERGLASRRRAMAAGPIRVLADMPISDPVPVREAVAPEADEALRAALGALRTMAARSR